MFADSPPSRLRGGLPASERLAWTAIACGEDSGSVVYSAGLAELIEGQGFTTNTACNLRDARTQVSNRIPDVALVDLYLPDGSGIQVCSELRSWSDMPIVVVSAVGDEDQKVAALEVWLFDKNDIKTATKVLMTEHAYNDPNIRARLEPKGELVVVMSLPHQATGPRVEEQRHREPRRLNIGNPEGMM